MVDEELWVFGGVSGPDGSSPPSTDQVPPGWAANEEVIVYGPDGSERRRYDVPGIAGHTIWGAAVIAGEEGQYLLANLCPGTATVGCSSVSEPSLVRFHGDDAAQVPLRLPAADFEAGDGYVSVIGHRDRHLWVSQVVADPSPLPVDQTRLLAIDVATGVGEEVELPAGLVDQGTLCLADGDIYVVKASLDSTDLTGLRVMRRPATLTPADWVPVAEPEIDLTTVYGATLECLPGDELALLVRAYPHGYVLTYDAVTGSVVTPRFDVPRDGVHVVGHVEGRAVLASRTGPDASSLSTHEPGGPWQPSGVEISRDVVPIVIRGELRDARSAVTSTRPDHVELPVIELTTSDQDDGATVFAYDEGSGASIIERYTDIEEFLAAQPGVDRTQLGAGDGVRERSCCGSRRNASTAAVSCSPGQCKARAACRSPGIGGISSGGPETITEIPSPRICGPRGASYCRMTSGSATGELVVRRALRSGG